MKFKTLRKVLIFAAVMLLLCVSAFAATSITTKEDLESIRDNLDGDYQIAKDIVLNDPSMFNYDENGVIISAKEGAEPWEPIEGFTGTLTVASTGRYFITGLYVPEDYAIDGVAGLFATTDGATINHVRVDYSLVEGAEYAGLIVGKAIDTDITYCLASGSVIGKTTQVQNTEGGVAGYLDANSTMSNTVSYATVSGANSYSSNIGGLVGYNAGAITNSASDAKVAGAAKYYDAAVGGIAGSNAGTIQNCTNQGTVMGETTSPVNDVYVGGIAGINNGTITVVKNTGAVSASVYASGNSIGAAGGIVGMLVDVDMDDVSNEGAVTGYYTYNGGIAGVAISTDEKHTISNAKNTGTITDTYGVNGGIAGRAVAGGEGYVSTIMHFENCQTSSGTLYGEAGTVESAQVTGSLGTATITAPTTKSIITPTSVEDNQIVTATKNVVANYPTVYKPDEQTGVPVSAAFTVRREAFDGAVVVRYTPTLVSNIEAAESFIPNPVRISVTIVSDLNAMEIVSVDKSDLTLESGKLNGTVVVKVFNPNLVNAATILGTSVEKQFVSAKFGNLDTANKITTLEIAFNNVSISNTTATDFTVNAMVVDSTDNMAPLCENKAA